MIFWRNVLFFVLLANGVFAQFDIEIALCDGGILAPPYVPKKRYFCTYDEDKEYKFYASTYFRNPNEANIVWKGAGIIRTGFEDLWNNGSVFPFVIFKPSNTTISVTWDDIVNLPGGISYPVCMYGIVDIHLMPPPRAPEIEVTNKIVESNGTVSIFMNTNGCVFNIMGVNQPEWGRMFCDEFLSERRFGNSYGINVNSNASFAIRCIDNGCIGEPSKPVHVFVNSPPDYDLCNEPDMKIIDEAVKSNPGVNYHYFSREKKICNKSDDNNCTLENVFKILKNSVTNTTPIPADFISKGEFKESIPFSKLFFPVPEQPVVSCGRVDLPGVWSMMVYTSIKLLSKLYPEVNVEKPLVSNPMFFYVNNSSHCITNYTLEDHFLYAGKITRCVIEDDCNIKVTTVGEGNSDFGDGLGGGFVAWLNAQMGQILFESIDDRFIKRYKGFYK